GQGQAAEHLDVAARGAGPGPDDDVGQAVPVAVDRAGADPAEEAGEAEEAEPLGPRQSVEDLDGAARAEGAGPHDDVGEAVAVDVAAGHVDRAEEAGEAQDAADEGVGPGVEDLDVAVEA